jgi:ABC-type microcin C transport system duplicated ATPase subunit YejF
MNFKPKVQMVFQDPFGLLNPRLTVESAISEAIQVGRRMSPSELGLRW